MKPTGSLRLRSALIGVLSLLLILPIATAPAQAAEPPDGLPTFGYQGEITVPEQMKYNPNDEYIFPSVFHAGAYLDDPLAEWYLYTAPHDQPGGIILLYADSLEGPWTEYGDGSAPLIANVWDPYYSVSHVSTPEAVWNAEAGTMVMYYHGENSTTRWATSDDGIHFTYGGVALSASMTGDGITNAVGYSRVFPHPDPASEYRWAMFYMSTEGGGPGLSGRRTIRLAESVDGFQWTIAPHYIVEPGEAEGENVSSANLWEWGGQLYVIYHASSGKIHARTIDPTLREVGAESFVLHQSSGLGDDLGRVAAPDIVTDGADTYLFYEGGARLGATIRWAKAGADVVVPPQFAGFPEDPDNPVFAQCAAAGSDEFDGEAVDTAIWDRAVRSDAAAHTIADGKLTVPTYSGGVADAPLLQQELPSGPWQVTTHVTINPTQKFQQAGLLLYGSDTRYAKFDLARATPGRRMELVFFNEGTNHLNQEPPAVTQNDVWLRLTSDGTTIRAAVSYDGQVFARYGDDISVAAGAFTHVGPFAFRGGAAVPQIDATFDWFRFSPDTDAYAECMDGGPAEPELTAVLAPAAPDGEGDWYRGPVTVTIAPEDGQTSTAIQYRLDGGDWMSYAAPFVVATDGSHEVSYRAGGEAAPVRSAEFAIDATAPTVSADRSGRTLTLAASDATSGVASVEYRLDSGTWTSYTSPVGVGAAAVSIDYRATDRAGNVSEVDAIEFGAAEPAIVVTPSSLVPGRTATVTGTGFAAGAELEVWLLSTPQRVGAVTAGPAGEFTFTFTVPADLAAGTHHIEIRDAASGATLVASAPITVSAVGGLAATGAASGAISSWLLALLLVSGVGLVVIDRLRRRRTAR